MIGRRIALLIVWGAVAATAASAQQIILDEPVRAGGLIFFQKLGDETSFYYAPARARLATHPNGKPQFSFLRYVDNVNDPKAERAEGEGGGIVHAVVALGVTDEELQEARTELSRARPGAKIAGPVVFRSGKFGLVSAFRDEGGDLTRKVIGLGSAPVLDGTKAAVSLQLTKQGAKILWQSFQTTTPDISFMFEMEMAGFRAPHRATIEAELDRVYEHKAFALGVATTYLQAEINQAYDDLYQQGAIRLTQVGEDESLKPLIATAYSKLTELVFQPAGAGLEQQIAQSANAGKKSVLDRASDLLEKRRKEVRDDNTRIRQARVAAARRQADRLSVVLAESSAPGATGATGAEAERMARLAKARASRSEAVASHVESDSGEAAAGADEQIQELPGFAAVLSYEMKTVRQRGRYLVDLNKYTADRLPVRFDDNIGDLRRYLGDDAVFRNVNLEDPLYQQREVIASLVDVNTEDFDKTLAFVSLQLRKKHESGDESLPEVRIDKAKLSDLGNRFKLVYGWKGDNDRRRWRSYEYRTMWAVVGAPVFEEPWRKADFNAIALTPPFQKRSVQLEVGNTEPLTQKGVRSISVQLFGSAGGIEQTSQVTLDTSKGELSKAIQTLLPRGQTSYEYQIQWRLKGNKSLSSGRQKTDQDILYLDELPEA